VKVADWWWVAARELPAGVSLGSILGVIGILRITAWQVLGFYDHGPYWPLVALTVGVALVGVVTFGSLAGSMLPFVLRRLGFDPASASAPFVATLRFVCGPAGPAVVDSRAPAAGFSHSLTVCVTHPRDP